MLLELEYMLLELELPQSVGLPGGRSRQPLSPAGLGR